MEYNGFKYQKLHSMSVSFKKQKTSCLTISYIIKYSVALVMSLKVVSKGSTFTTFQWKFKKQNFLILK